MFNQQNPKVLRYTHVAEVYLFLANIQPWNSEKVAMLLSYKRVSSFAHAPFQFGHFVPRAIWGSVSVHLYAGLAWTVSSDSFKVFFRIPNLFLQCNIEDLVGDMSHKFPGGRSTLRYMETHNPLLLVYAISFFIEVRRDEN